ncbi:MAG: GNAT family N-acetyltransferase [Leptolyngbyaceae cyanobacterium]
MDLPIYRQTKSSIPLCLDVMQTHEAETVRAMLNYVVQAEQSYPQAQPLTVADFAGYWLKGDAFVVRRLDAEKSGLDTVVGAFYLKPNFPGRCSHISNAGFIVAPELRGQGLGRWMGETMLTLARDRGYRAVMFNLVFETNLPSLRLWESLGFQEIGRVPQGVALSESHYVDAIMLYKSLVDNLA